MSELVKSDGTFCIYGICVPKCEIRKIYKRINRKNNNFFEQLTDNFRRDYSKDLKKSLKKESKYKNSEVRDLVLNLYECMPRGTYVCGEGFENFNIFESKYWFFIGREYWTIGKHETGKDFEKSVKKAFKDFKLGLEFNVYEDNYIHIM